jgi:hypothetical protein
MSAAPARSAVHGPDSRSFKKTDQSLSAIPSATSSCGLFGMYVRKPHTSRTQNLFCTAPKRERRPGCVGVCAERFSSPAAPPGHHVRAPAAQRSRCRACASVPFVCGVRPQPAAVPPLVPPAAAAERCRDEPSPRVLLSAFASACTLVPAWSPAFPSTHPPRCTAAELCSPDFSRRLRPLTMLLLLLLLLLQATTTAGMTSKRCWMHAPTSIGTCGRTSTSAERGMLKYAGMVVCAEQHAGRRAKVDALRRMHAHHTQDGGKVMPLWGVQQLGAEQVLWVHARRL